MIGRRGLFRYQWVVVLVAIGFAPVIGGAARAGAIVAPVTGSVTCTLTGASTFSPYMGYSGGLVGPHVGPKAKSRWKLQGTLSACTGSQAGGRPTTAPPIDHGAITIGARATGHQCADLAADGLEVRSIRVRWFNGAGKRIGATRVVDGSIDVENVGSLAPFPPPPPPPSGPPTFSGSASAIAASKVFPGQLVTLALLGDPIPLFSELPCSTTYPPVTQGIRGVSFSGVSGVSTVSVAP